MVESHTVEGASVDDAWHDVFLRVSQAVLAQRDVDSLLRILEDPSFSFIPFDRANLLLLDPRSTRATLYCKDDGCTGLNSIENKYLIDGPGRDVWADQKIVVSNGSDFFRDYPQLAVLRPYRNLGAYCQLPLTTSRQRLGGLEFIRTNDKAFTAKDASFLKQFAAIIAIALENMFDRDFSSAQEEHVRKEREHYRLLVEVTNTVISKLDMADLANEVSESIHRYFGFDYVSLDLCDLETEKLRSYSVLYQRDAENIRRTADFPMSTSLSGQVVRSRQPILVGRQEIETLAAKYEQIAMLAEKGFQTICAIPLISGKKVLGSLKLAHHRPYTYTKDKLELLDQITARIAIVLDNALAYEEISSLKDKLASENMYLSEEIRNYGGFNEIIGHSQAMNAVLKQVEMVAASDSTVLILGETGTGKELIARAIHKLSDRNAQTMVKMNCAAVPSGLLESDLFGHEKGAFTGATARRLGRFELAHNGTLFLDEVGDIPLELQPKLLRVLQEREIERLGGQKVIPVDARVIAATNCDLRQMVADRHYRSDLYYRLNVFPIVIPPLRDRPEDIPLLVKFFTQKFSRRMNRNIDCIPSETIARLMQMPWPGNVRELENIIERAVILTQGTVLNLPLDDLHYQPSPPERIIPSVSVPHLAVRAQTVAPLADDPSESERQKILRVLRETNGIVAGPKGAAARLGMKRTTLLSRMQRMGISLKNAEDSDLVSTAG